MQVQPTEPGVYSIGQLSRTLGTSPRALRYYESRGLLQPPREGPYRLYGRREYQRLVVILEARRLGLRVEQIQDLLDAYDPSDGGEAQVVKALQLLRQHLADLDKRRELVRQGLAELELRLPRARRSDRVTVGARAAA